MAFAHKCKQKTADFDTGKFLQEIKDFSNENDKKCSKIIVKKACSAEIENLNMFCMENNGNFVNTLLVDLYFLTTLVSESWIFIILMSLITVIKITRFFADNVKKVSYMLYHLFQTYILHSIVFALTEQPSFCSPLPPRKVRYGKPGRDSCSKFLCTADFSLLSLNKPIMNKNG